jgi:hypothetical protein
MGGSQQCLCHYNQAQICVIPIAACADLRASAKSIEEGFRNHSPSYQSCHSEVYRESNRPVADKPDPACDYRSEVSKSLSFAGERV